MMQRIIGGWNTNGERLPNIIFIETVDLLGEETWYMRDIDELLVKE